MGGEEWKEEKEMNKDVPAWAGGRAGATLAPMPGKSLPWERHLHCPEGPGNRRPAALAERRSSRACGGPGQAGAWRRRGLAPPL